MKYRDNKLFFKDTWEKLDKINYFYYNINRLN